MADRAALTVLAIPALMAACWAVPDPATATAPAPERVFVTREQLRDMGLRPTARRPIRSLLNVTRRLRHGEFVWDERGVPNGPVWIRVDPNTQLISAFRAGHEIGTAVILYGTDRYPTPAGVFPILTKIRKHRSSTYDAPMPYTLRLTRDGVAIHGSDVRWGVASHGCVGVPVEFARNLFSEAKIGDPVEVLRLASD